MRTADTGARRLQVAPNTNGPLLDPAEIVHREAPLSSGTGSPEGTTRARHNAGARPSEPSSYRPRPAPARTSAQAVSRAGTAFANALATCAQMTPREQAEAAWSPTARLTVDELEDRIRARRGMAPAQRGVA